MALKVQEGPTRALFAPTKSAAKPNAPPRAASLASASGAKGTTERRPRKRKSPLECFQLDDPRHALLCAPASYTDCREANREVNNSLLDVPSSLYLLTYSGRMRGIDSSKRTVWSIPGPRLAQPADLQFWQMRQARRIEIELVDASGKEVRLSVFGAVQEWNDIAAGQELLLVGEIARYGPNYYMKLEKRAPVHVLGSIWSKYAGIPGQIAGEKIEAFVAAALQDDSSPRACVARILGETGMAEQALLKACPIEGDDGEQAAFVSLAEMIQALHRPDTVARGRQAMDCARRISALAIQAAALRHHSRPPHPKAPIAIDPFDIDRLAQSLSLKLTEGQLSVARTIAHRMTEPKPLSALLSGDVGTGKTLAFLLPAIAAHRAGASVAIITPRSLLADQIAEQLITRFADMVQSVERISAGGKIKDPKSLIVSTPGLASVAARQGYVPHVLICDEQHKFSATTREALVGPHTHLVEVSATPVPRSLAASLYEGLEILNLRECPVNKTIHSTLVDKATNGPMVIAAIRQALAKGERAAIIYPSVTAQAVDDEDEKNADEAKAPIRQSVESAYATLSAAFPGKVTMLHGSLSEDELRANVQLLRSGERPLVVASTVLEIGLDIPSVSVMVVRDADRFGISQLHQLRGRLVRNGGEGHFMAVVEDVLTAPPSSIERIEAVCATSDGYELAELDLVQRGFGQVDGDEQSGASITLFRQVRLGVRDFMAKRLKTQDLPQDNRAPPARALPQSNVPRYAQPRLI